VHQDLEAEAAIVNYYPLGTCMGGHLDDAEHIMTKPIVSISIGCSALFLIGGDQKSITPTPILVRSGDAIIMSGRSRYSYHGIPTILPPTFRPVEHYYPLTSIDPTVSYHKIAELEKYYHETYSTDSGNTTAEYVNSVDEQMTIVHPSSNSDKKRSHKDMDSECDSIKHVVKYLQQARINMNVRQVRITNDDSSWVDKAGSGASYTGTDKHNS